MTSHLQQTTGVLTPEVGAGLFGTAATDAKNRFDKIRTPQVRLTRGSLVTIENREYRVDRLLRDTWEFLGKNDNEPKFKTHAEIATLMAKGEFYVNWQPGDRDDLSAPPDPLNVGPDAHAENLRKLDYVQSCLAHPNYSRYRPTLNAIIEEVAQRRNEEAQAFTTVLNWIDRYEQHSDSFGSAALSDHHDRKGNRADRWCPQQEQAIEKGIEQYLTKKTKSASYATVYDTIRKLNDSGEIDKATVHPDHLDENGKLKIPSLRTFERRCDLIDPFVRDTMRIGAGYARQRYRTFATTERPDRPYAHVEVDHGTLDITLIHPSGTLLGRPDVVVFKDRATGMVIGYAIGFEAPSYTTFMDGLRNALYPKDMSLYSRVQNPWPAFGRIENLYTDNAKHLIGDNIHEACRELKINLLPLAPRQPWHKGSMERYFHSLNTGLVHQLDGTTLSNPVVRRDHEDIPPAALTLEQFDQLLRFWICDIYNAGESKGLGFIRGFGGQSPLDAWAEKSKDFTVDSLPPPHLFSRLAGHVAYRALQKNGFSVDNITYESAALAKLLGNPKHKAPRVGQLTTKYKIVIDPHDISQARVINHHTGEIIDVPATTAHLRYASGLSLNEHQIISARAREGQNKRRKLTIDKLMRAKASLNEYTKRVMTGRKFKTVQRQYARWINAEQTRRFRSEVHTVTGTEVDYLESVASLTSQTHAVAKFTQADVNFAEPTHSGGPKANNKSRAAPPAIIPPSTMENDDDLTETMNRVKWSSTHEYI